VLNFVLFCFVFLIFKVGQIFLFFNMSYFYSNLAKEDTKKKREKNAIMLLKAQKRQKKPNFKKRL
jgi:hypothetical protein